MTGSLLFMLHTTDFNALVQSRWGTLLPKWFSSVRLHYGCAAHLRWLNGDPLLRPGSYMHGLLLNLMFSACSRRWCLVSWKALQSFSFICLVTIGCRIYIYIYIRLQIINCKLSVGSRSLRSHLVVILAHHFYSCTPLSVQCSYWFQLRSPTILASNRSR